MQLKNKEKVKQRESGKQHEKKKRKNGWKK